MASKTTKRNEKKAIKLYTKLAEDGKGVAQDLEKAISREQKRAELAETNLQSQLNSEIDRSKTEETSLLNKIIAKQDLCRRWELLIPLP